MGAFVSIINQILYFAYSTIDQIFRVFGLSWVTVAVGFAVIAAVLRLLTSNLVGAAMTVGSSRPQAAHEQRIAKKTERRSVGRGASKSSPHVVGRMPVRGINGSISLANPNHKGRQRLNHINTFYSNRKR